MARHSWNWLAVVVAVIGAPAARAGLVTPDSIGSPVLSSAIEGSPVAAGGLVANQYQSLGLLFPTHSLGDPASSYSTAVIGLNNRDVFITAAQWGTPDFRVSDASHYSPGGVTAAFVLPGTTTPDVADSVTLSLYSSGPIFAQLQAFDKNGRLVKTIDAQVAGETNTPIVFDVADIQSVNAQVFQPIIGPPIPGFQGPTGYPFAWGVSSIEWHEAPEPAGLVLGGLGMCALLGYALRRRLICLGVRGA